MAIEGRVRIKCDAKVLDRSYRYKVLIKERYGDVTGQLGDQLPHPKQDKLVFSGKRWLAQHHSETCLRYSSTWRRHESMFFDANEKYILVSSP